MNIDQLRELAKMVRDESSIVDHMIAALISSGEIGVVNSPIILADNKHVKGFIQRGIFYGVGKDDMLGLIIADIESNDIGFELKNIRTAHVDDLLLMLSHTKFSLPEVVMQKFFRVTRGKPNYPTIEIVFTCDRLGTNAPLHIPTEFLHKFRPELLQDGRIIYDGPINSRVIVFINRFIRGEQIYLVTCSEYIMAAQALNYLLA